LDACLNDSIYYDRHFFVIEKLCSDNQCCVPEEIAKKLCVIFGFDYYLLCVGAGFNPVRKPPRLLLRAGINPAPTSILRLSLKFFIEKFNTILLTSISGTQH